MAKRKTKANKTQYKTGDRLLVHVDNQISRIGTGYRHIEIARMGWKWVKLKSIHFDDRLVFTQRIKRSVFDKINIKRIL